MSEHVIDYLCIVRNGLVRKLLFLRANKTIFWKTRYLARALEYLILKTLDVFCMCRDDIEVNTVFVIIDGKRYVYEEWEIRLDS